MPFVGAVLRNSAVIIITILVIMPEMIYILHKCMCVCGGGGNCVRVTYKGKKMMGKGGIVSESRRFIEK